MLNKKRRSAIFLFPIGEISTHFADKPTVNAGQIAKGCFLIELVCCFGQTPDLIVRKDIKNEYDF